MLLLRNNVQQ